MEYESHLKPRPLASEPASSQNEDVAQLSYERARDKVERLLSDGQWHTRVREIGNLLPNVPDGWFLRIKQDLDIEHRFYGVNGVGSRGPGSCVEWRLPN